MAHYVYVLDMLSYGSVQRSKIGISKNVEARVRRMGTSFCGLWPCLYATFALPDEKAARAVEGLVIKKFPRASNRHRELLAAPPDEVAHFVEAVLRG